MIKSIKESCENEIIINKSRFIGIVVHLQSVAMVKDYLEYYKELYPEATHYCYAYIFNDSSKANDDGEPSKTAGAPILNVIQKQELNHILAIVIRYFGGVKLGAGGLVRAYTQAISQVLQIADIVEYVSIPLYKVSFDYSYLKQVDYQMKKLNIKIIDKDYQEKVIYQCFVNDSSFFDWLQEITSNQYDKEYLHDEFIEKEASYE